MKVICINNKPLPGRTNNDAVAMLKEGTTYTVIKIVPSDIGLPPAYGLYETQGDAFCSTRFIPLDGPDETEILAERGITEERVKELIQNAVNILNDQQ